MCGLAGMFSLKLEYSDTLFFKELLTISALRGTDSTGVLKARYKPEADLPDGSIKRNAISPSDFVQRYAEFSTSWMMDSSCDLYMGHTRSATTGAFMPSEKDAHPFDVGTIVGSHNGTLIDMKYRNKGMTDSEALFRAISIRRKEIAVEEAVGGEVVYTEENLIQSMKEHLEDLAYDSAYAITVWDKSTNKMFFARNSERPLWFGFNTKRPVMYWASERDFLSFCADRRTTIGKDIELIKLEVDNIISVDPSKIAEGNSFTTYGIKRRPEPQKKKSHGMMTKEEADAYMKKWDDGIDYGYANYKTM